jgi:hypothetical protein
MFVLIGELARPDTLLPFSLFRLLHHLLIHVVFSFGFRLEFILGQCLFLREAYVGLLGLFLS